jgi:Phage integrase central domain
MEEDPMAASSSPDHSEPAGSLQLFALSPRLTFAEVAGRWLAEFEAKVAADERRERTLDLYRSQLFRHLLPRLGRRRLALITADDVVAVTRELQASGLSPWTIKRILGALSCVFTFALRRGYISAHPFDRLERDERPHPLPSDQRVLTQTELARLFAACPRRYRPLLLTGHARTSMTLDTYTHLFEEARHGADVRAELAKSNFANLLSAAVRPPLQAGEHLRLTRAPTPRRMPDTAVNRRRCAPHGPSQRRCDVTKT